MIRLILSGFVFAFALWISAGVTSKALAVECIKEHGIVVPSYQECDPKPEGGGGDMPIPFGLNGKVELADGEFYLLVGKITVLPKQRSKKTPRVFFEVDFDQHPWLANAKRYANPGYPVEGPVSFWKKYDGHQN